MFLLYQLPATLGAVAMKILNYVITTNPSAKEIYLIFYEYRSPSIKDNEHILRDNITAEYELKGKYPSEKIVYILYKQLFSHQNLTNSIRLKPMNFYNRF